MRSGEHLVLRGQRDRTRVGDAVHDEGNVHGPIAAARFAELARPVERVDDPHPLAFEPYEIVLRLLRQDRVVGTARAERGENELVGFAIAVVFARRRVPADSNKS